MSITARATLRKAGGSLIATIPKEFVDAHGLREGDEIVVSSNPRLELLKQFAGTMPDLPSWDRRETRDRDRY